jgi:hypothetical protein
MRRTRWTMYAWPGLPHLWTRGSWSALAVAVSAGALLNLALLATLVWTELLAEGFRQTLWLGLLIGWPAAALFSAAWLRRQANREQPASPGESGAATFEEAQEHYLKGNWFEAERVLGILLQRNARDLEARLMLATLCRHTRRLDEAARQLDLLGRCEGAERWDWEICRERELLTEARADELENRTEAAAAQDDAAPPAAAAPDHTTPPDEMMHAA